MRSAVTATVTGGPAGRVHPDRPAEEARSQPARAAADVSQRQPFPNFMRRYMTGASGAHLEPVEPEDDRKIPKFLRRHGAAHAQPIASDREPSERSQVDQPSGFVRRVPREARAVTPPITQTPPAPASVTPTVTAAPVGSICPTCQRRVPARLSAAERQRAYRERKREQAKLVVPYPGGVPAMSKRQKAQKP
jgi:hypothetical protein